MAVKAVKAAAAKPAEKAEAVASAAKPAEMAERAERAEAMADEAEMVEAGCNLSRRRPQIGKKGLLKRTLPLQPRSTMRGVGTRAMRSRERLSAPRH